MKNLKSLLAGSLALAGGGMIAFGGPEASVLDPKDVVMEDAGKAVMIEDGSPWFISAGAVVRSIDAGFRLDGHDHISLNWRHYVNQKSGKGDVGLFNGSGAVVYDDGLVGKAGTESGSPGETAGIISHRSQVYDSGKRRRDGSVVPSVDFHTDDYRYGSSLNQDTLHSSDSQTGVGPYIRIGYELSGGPTLINVVIGWSFVSTEHSSGMRQLAAQSVRETRTAYTYTYDLEDDDIFDDIFAFPLDTADSEIQGDFVINPALNDPTGFDNTDAPRKRSEESHLTAARFFAVGSSRLDVDLNEIPLGVEVGRQFGNLSVFLTGGATLNVIGYDLNSQVSWYQAGHSRALTTERWRDSGTELKIGLYGGLAAKYPLTASGNVYLEAHGSYRWVDPVNASAGFADVEIDPSSWEGGLGIGIVLP